MMLIMSICKPLRLYLSYSDRDRLLVQDLEKHLGPLYQEHIFQECPMLLPGADRRAERERRIGQADIVLALVSKDYLAENQAAGSELERIVAGDQSGAVLAIAVLLRDVDRGAALLQQLCALPTDGRSVASHRVRDQAWRKIVTGLRAAATDWVVSQGLPEQAGVLHASHRVARSTRKLALRAPADWSAGSDGDVVYVTSASWGVARALRVRLDRHAGELLAHLIRVLHLQPRIDDGARIGVRVQFQLALRGAPLSPDRSLMAQGVSPGQDLWLLTALEPIEDDTGLGWEGRRLLRRGTEASEHPGHDADLRAIADTILATYAEAGLVTPPEASKRAVMASSSKRGCLRAPQALRRSLT